MNRPISDNAYTPTVKTAQEKRGSRRSYAKMEQREDPGWRDIVTPELEEYIAERDFLYLGTASADGQPYIQYRGGPKGFLKVLDEHTLAFADFAGNAQYISLGNLIENNKAFMFLMDYPNQPRVKIWGTAEFIEEDSELLQKLVDTDYKARPERALCFHVEAWSPNCPQHIEPRFTVEEMAPRIEELHQCVAGLKNTIATLREQLGEVAREVGTDRSAELIASLLEEIPTAEEGCGVD